MNTITIKDLAATEELDSRAMTAVRGGSFYYPALQMNSYDLSFSAQQAIGQTQNVWNANGNNVAFATDIHSTVNPKQTATNNNSVGSGLLQLA